MQAVDTKLLAKLVDINVAIDSRLVKKGDYFVAVKGENFDGHDYIDKAIQNGAAGVLEESDLYKLASIKLKKYSPKVVAVTGSLGKSTTRKFIAESLSAKHKVAEGDLNTKLGLAVNIVNEVNKNTEYFVAECGMDKIGELKITGEFLNPDIVVLTNISESHMEKLGSIKNIIQAKSELLRTVKKSGRIYINWSDKNVQKAVKYSNTKNITRYVKEDIYKLPTFPNIISQHNLINLLCAYKIAQDEGVSKSKLINKQNSITKPKGRLNLLAGVKGSVIIDDTYNASPQSTINALKTVTKYYTKHKLNGRKIAVLGGMLELGNFEETGHTKVGREIVKQKFDIVVLVGELANKFNKNNILTNSGVKVKCIKKGTTAGKYISANLKPSQGDILLFKASQGIRLEKAIPFVLRLPKQAKNLLVRQDARWK